MNDFPVCGCQGDELVSRAGLAVEARIWRYNRVAGLMSQMCVPRQVPCVVGHVDIWGHRLYIAAMGGRARVVLCVSPVHIRCDGLYVGSRPDEGCRSW